MVGWIAVDFDGTLATYDTWVSASHVGEPVPAMVERVKRWLAEGRDVRIFTARIHPLDRCFFPLDPVLAPVQITTRVVEAMASIEAIRSWCLTHIGAVLPITNIKDYGMVELFDDRAVQVRPNTGELVGQSTRGLE